MGAAPVLTYREVELLFNRGGATFKRQRGSHRTWHRVVESAPVMVTIPAHRDGDEVPHVYITKARRAWRLTETDGVSDEEFYAGEWPAR